MEWRKGSEPPPSSGKDWSVHYLVITRIGPTAYHKTATFTDKGWSCLETGAPVRVEFWLPIPESPSETKDWTLDYPFINDGAELNADIVQWAHATGGICYYRGKRFQTVWFDQHRGAWVSEILFAGSGCEVIVEPDLPRLIEKIRRHERD